MTKASTVVMGAQFGELEVASPSFSVTQPSGKRRRCVVTLCSCGQISRTSVGNLTTRSAVEIHLDYLNGLT